jgi:NAD(P)H-hydrate repair Nnr-like enzyme with NAD(P)H-hydrate epimerase domain
MEGRFMSSCPRLTKLSAAVSCNLELDKDRKFEDAAMKLTKSAKQGLLAWNEQLHDSEVKFIMPIRVIIDGIKGFTLHSCISHVRISSIIITHRRTSIATVHDGTFKIDVFRYGILRDRHRFSLRQLS